MKLAAIFDEKIYSMNQEEFDRLFLKHENNEKYECEEKQLFLFEKDEGLYIAVDNRSGDFFVEAFTIEEDAIIWLIDLKCAEVLHKAERNGRDVWW